MYILSSGPGARRPPAKVVHAPLGVTIIDIDEETVVLLDEAIAALMNRDPALRPRQLRRSRPIRANAVEHLPAAEPALEDNRPQGPSMTTAPRCEGSRE